MMLEACRSKNGDAGYTEVTSTQIIDFDSVDIPSRMYDIYIYGYTRHDVPINIKDKNYVDSIVSFPWSYKQYSRQFQSDDEAIECAYKNLADLLRFEYNQTDSLQERIVRIHVNRSDSKYCWDISSSLEYDWPSIPLDKSDDKFIGWVRKRICNPDSLSTLLRFGTFSSHFQDIASKADKMTGNTPVNYSHVLNYSIEITDVADEERVPIAEWRKYRTALHDSYLYDSHKPEAPEPTKEVNTSPFNHGSWIEQIYEGEFSSDSAAIAFAYVRLRNRLYYEYVKTDSLMYHAPCIKIIRSEDNIMLTNAVPFDWDGASINLDDEEFLSWVSQKVIGSSWLPMMLNRETPYSREFGNIPLLNDAELTYIATQQVNKQIREKYRSKSTDDIDRLIEAELERYRRGNPGQSKWIK